MTSVLKITSVEGLHAEVISTLESIKGVPGIYVSLNKTQKSVEESLKEHNIDTTKLFFVDCVTSEKTRDDVLHVSPDQLDLLSAVINEFIKDIDGEKFLIVDALATLLIYNDEKKVAKFVKEITDYASREGVKVIAFSPETKGEELLKAIFNFFDEVKK